MRQYLTGDKTKFRSPTTTELSTNVLTYYTALFFCFLRMNPSNYVNKLILIKTNR